MKTVGELIEWCAGAEAEYGDPAAAVGQIFVRYQQALELDERLLASYSIADEALVLSLGFMNVLCVLADEPAIDPLSGSLLTFRIDQVVPGVWHLTPSLNLPGALHVFVVLYDVPDPAPWDRQLVDAAGAPLSLARL